jgi:hypothetical protein
MACSYIIRHGMRVGGTPPGFMRDVWESCMGRMIMQQMVNIIRLAGWDAYLNAQLDGASAFPGMIRSGGKEVEDPLEMPLDMKHVPDPSHNSIHMATKRRC